MQHLLQAITQQLHSIYTNRNSYQCGQFTNEGWTQER